LQSLQQYVLGLQPTQEMKDNAFIDMGDIGYDLTVLCRTLKTKMPAATKKSKLQGTRTAALLQLDSLATEMLGIVSAGAFDGPKMTRIKKEVVLPNKGGVKEVREVDVVATADETNAEAERQTKLKSLLAAAVDVYWKLCFDIFQQPPAPVLAAKFARMEQQYPNVAFDKGEAKPKTGPTKVVAQKGAKPKKETVTA